MSQAKAVKTAKPAKAQLSNAEKRVLKHLLEQEPRYEDLQLSKLQIDWSYQDRPRETLVGQIAEYFAPAMVGTFQVSRRPDGSLFCCDGATRKLGMERGGRGNQIVRCQMHDTDGPKQEALLFKHYNAARKAVPLANRLTAEGIAGIDHGFLKSVKQTGFKLTGTSRNALKGAGFVKKAFEIDEGESMTKALFALKATWGDKRRLDGIIVLGLAMMYAKIRNCDQQIRRWLGNHTNDDLFDVTHRTYGGGKSLKQDARLRPNHMPWFIAKGMGLDINRRSREGRKLNLSALDAMRDEWQIIQAHAAN